MRDDMTENWKRWEGRTVDSRFPLQSYLGGSGHSAVFLTEHDGGKAAIKLIPANAYAEAQLARWNAARPLKHPNLIAIFEAGRCELDGVNLLYVVEEYAEENLAQILPERALTADETRGLLPPVLQALDFVHEKRLVHGHIQPSNILAIGDLVKLSSDTLLAVGDTAVSDTSERATDAYGPPETEASSAGDVWQLGMTLVEVLTQRLPGWHRAGAIAPQVPGTIPQPFREIAEHSLQFSPAKRWTISEIRNRLEGKPVAVAAMQVPSRVTAPPSIPLEQKSSPKWPYLLGLVAVVAIVVFLIAKPKSSNQPAEMPPTVSENSPSVQGSGETGSTAAPGNSTANNHTDAHLAVPPVGNVENGVVQRVMPQVSPSARRTVHGKIEVRVKVEVDPAGNVTKAKIDSGGRSRYFSRLALDAAREWKFSPAPAGDSGIRVWKVQFGFSRSDTDASAVPLSKGTTPVSR